MYIILGYRFFLFIALNIFATAFWPAQFLLKIQQITLIGFPYILLDVLLLLPFIFFCLYWIITFILVWFVCVSAFLLCLYYMGVSVLPELYWLFLSHFRKVFDCDLFEYFFRPFLFLLFWDPSDSNVGVLNVVLEVSDTVLTFFLSFLFVCLLVFCSMALISTILYSCSLFFCLAYSAVDLFFCIFISVIVLLITVSLFFGFVSLLSISYIFLVSASIFSHDLGSSLLSLLWIPFSGWLLISSSFISGCSFIMCFYLCTIFLCHLIWSHSLCLGSYSHRQKGHISSCFLCLPPRGWVWSRALFRLPFAHALVGGSQYCFPGGQGFVRGRVLGASVTLGQH